MRPFACGIIGGATLLRGSDQMAEHSSSLVARSDHALIGVCIREDGQDLVRYTTDDEERDLDSDQASVERALSLAGAWSDLDWEEAEKELDRIRHESKPTPPITDL